MKRLQKHEAATYLRNPVVSEKLSVGTREALDAKRLSLKPVVVFVRKEIAIGKGTIPLVNSNTKKVIGITNLEDNRLPAFRNIIFNAVSLGYSADAASGKESAVSYKSSLPASLRNAEIEVKQDGKVIFSVPCSEFEADHAFNSENGRYLDLGGNHLIREEKSFEINLVFPEGAAGGGTVDYVEVRLSGIETVEQ